MNQNHYLQSLRTLRKGLLLFTTLLLICFTAAHAQTNRQLSGTIKNKAGAALSGVSLKLVSEKDSVHTSTDNAGFFSFRNVQGVNFKLTATSLGYDTLVTEFQFEANRSQMLVPQLVMEEAANVLEAVSVTAKLDIVVKEDTLEYSTKDLKLREGALAEDALKKLSGVEVDKDGNVTAQGEAITRIRINGKDFFGGDVKAATRNLPADIIEKIQIIDDYGDMANITGNRTGDPERILNIQIDPARNKGSMGNFRVGGGSEERYQVTGMLGYMTEKMQITGLGNMNNVNASLFDFNIRGGGARRQGGGGGGMGGGGNFGGGGNGLTNTNSIGLNYRQDFSTELTMYGNYSFGINDNKTLSMNVNDYFNEKLLEVRDNTSGTKSTNHRFDWNVEYKPTDVDYFKLSPTLSLSNSNSTSNQISNNTLNSDLINRLNTQNLSESYAPNYGISGLYNRRLSSKGRNFFVNFNLNTSVSEQDQDRIEESAIFGEIDTETYIRTMVDLKNQSLNGGASVNYTEPLSDKANFEVSYDYNFRTYDNRRFDNALDGLGNQITDDPTIFIGDRIFDYSFVTHRVGANYRYRSDKIIYSIGASVQPSHLFGDATVNNDVYSINRRGLNFAPIARFEYKFSRTKSFNFRYNGRSNEPSFSQLQPYTDASNRTSIVTGNPNLDAEFVHDLRFSFNNFDVASGQSYMFSINGSLTEDKIVSNRTIVVDPQLGVVNQTSYLNTDGYYNLRAHYNYSIPFKERTYVVSFNGFAGYTNNISFNQDVKAIGKNWNASQGINFRYNPTEFMEFNPGVRYNYNSTSSSNNSRGGSANNVVNTWSYSFNTNFNITPTLVLGGDLIKTSNSGYNSSLGANPFIINAYVEKQFFKGRNGAIRFQAYDILNEQTNISRNVSDNLISDSRSNRLGQYFMLTLSYRFQKFAGGNMGFNQGGQGGPGGMGRMGGMGGNMGGGMGRPGM